MKKYTLALLSALLLPTFVLAEVNEEDYTRLTFRESVDKEVDQDRVRATLSFRAEAKDAASVQSDVNKAMAKFVEQVKRVNGLDVYTGSYNVNQRWNARTKSYEGWEGKQTVFVEGEDKASIIKQVERAQRDGFVTDGLAYFLSKAAKQAVRDELIAKALGVVKHRAKLVSENLGKPEYHLAKIDVNYQMGSQQPSPMYATMMDEGMVRAKQFSAPVVEGRTQTVSVTLNAVVLLNK